MGVLGNRGKCAQPCRLPYELLKITENNSNSTSFTEISQKSEFQTLDKGYLLSPKDLCSLDLLPTLVNLGITCFKIEGRLKNPEYVSTVTRIYHKYIDLAQSDKPYVIDEKDRKDLLQVFNRGGFSKGYLDAEPNQKFVSKDKPNNMGIYIGTVHNFNSNKGYITLKLEDNIAIGDTVSLEKEKGSYTISELMIDNQNIPSAKKGNIVKIGRIKGRISVNDKIFKMSSKELCELANEYVNSEQVKQKINCKIVVHKNEPVSMQVYTNIHDDNIYNNINFTITSDLVPVDSINSPITTERIVEQINKLGGTPFEFEKIDVDLENNLYLPSISKLNQLRRDCITKLEDTLLERIHRKCDNTYDEKNKTTSNNANYSSKSTNINDEKTVSILLNVLNISENYSNLRKVDKAYIPLKYFFMTEYKNIIDELSNITNCYIYMPSVLKDSVLTQISIAMDDILSNYKIKGFVISNISQLYLFKDYLDTYEFIGNYTLNVYNNNTICELEASGISCITLSPELDKDSLNSFCTGTKTIKTEAIIYGNLPVMTTNYCFLSKSNFCLEKCKNNCSNSRHKYYLKDRLNMNFRVIPDSFSKTTTIYNNKKTSISINEVDVNCVRFSFIDESIEEINNIIETFKRGEILEGKDFTNGNFKRFV